MNKEQNTESKYLTANFDNTMLSEGLTEKDLIEVGFSKNLMVGTGWLTINSMQDAVYYYKKGRITINATRFWTWFIDDEQRNDIAVNNRKDLISLIETFA